jgi:hypothetical protein
MRHPPRRATAAPAGDGTYTGLRATARLRSEDGQTAPPRAAARPILHAPGGRDRHRLPRDRTIGEGRAAPSRSGAGLARLARAPDHHKARLTETTAPAFPARFPGDLCNSLACLRQSPPTRRSLLKRATGRRPQSRNRRRRALLHRRRTTRVVRSCDARGGKRLSALLQVIEADRGHLDRRGSRPCAAPVFVELRTLSPGGLRLRLRWSDGIPRSV